MKTAVFFKKNKNLIIFIGFLLLAGIAYIFTRTGRPALDAAMICINYITYLGLLLFWLQSVRTRLLPSDSRTYLTGVAFLMLLFMLLRIFKYRITADEVIPTRYAVYLYWIPQILIPALFLMTCICIHRDSGQNSKKWNEKILLIPAGLLSLMALTNDLHFLVYVPSVDLSGFIVDSGTYSWGPGFYIFYTWMIIAMTAGLVLLFRKSGKASRKTIIMLIVVLVIWITLQMNVILAGTSSWITRMYSGPETHIFSMLGIIEICIRHRLIPYNENYTGFFVNLRYPVLITDSNLSPVYSSGAKPAADLGSLKAALMEPVYYQEDRKLYGRPIRAGYAFWAEDESSIRRTQEELLEANEMIEQENSLIQAETEQKEKEAYLQSRHHIYHEIAQEMYPVQKRIEEILEDAEPGKAGFCERIALVSVLNAYVKRKTNMLLLASEQDTLSTDELFLALSESASYLGFAGLNATALKPSEQRYPSGQIIALYDAFEMFSEQLIGMAPSLMVTWNGAGLCLAADAKGRPDKNGIELPVRFRENEDILYMDIYIQERGSVL